MMIGEAISLTKEMLVEAGRDNWDKLQEIDQERQQLLEKLPEDLKGGVSQEVLKDLQLMLALNDELTALLLSRKDKISVDLQKIKKGKQAMHAYKNN